MAIDPKDISKRHAPVSERRSSDATANSQHVDLRRHDGDGKQLAQITVPSADLSKEGLDIAVKPAADSSLKGTQWRSMRARTRTRTLRKG
jgi:hypothetical protein